MLHLRYTTPEGQPGQGKGHTDRSEAKWRGSRLPVEGYSRGVRLRQVVHQRGPAAPCGREREGLGTVVVHHLQTPVSIQRHGVTWRKQWLITHTCGNVDIQYVYTVEVRSLHKP
jgi:hypothetical protein